MSMITGGELVVRTLLQAGVDNVFALYGGHLETIFQGIREHKIPFLDVRHEVAAGHAAEGYARAAQKLGVALITAGPGFTNVITSITNAYLDRTPVLYIAASIPQNYAEANMVQGGFDQVAIAKPITKWANRVTSTSDIPRLLAHAIRIATSDPPGPVLLDIPMDVSYALIDEDSVVIPKTIIADTPALPREDAIDSALHLLENAKRPVIMVGEGAWQCKAEEELRVFVKSAGIPVFSDYQGHGLMQSSDPLYAGGFFKMLELSEPQLAPDVILALGVRFGVYTLGASRLVPANAKVIHVECDAKEIGRVRDVDIAIVADSREVLLALNIKSGTHKWPDWSAWQKVLQSLRFVREQRFAEQLTRRSSPLHPYQAAKTIINSMPCDTIVVADGAEAHQWIAEVIRQEEPGRFFTHGHLGCLGFGMGFAMGVMRAHPNKHVLCITGDGGVGITLAEFDTMARHNLPIVVVIMNNRTWGATKRFQDFISGPGKNIAVNLSDARYHDVAIALGCHGKHITEIDQLLPALAASFECGKPSCINVEIELADMPPDSAALMSHA